MYNSHNCKHWQYGEICGAKIGPDDKGKVCRCWASYGLDNEFNACFEKVNEIDRYEGKREIENERN